MLEIKLNSAWAAFAAAAVSGGCAIGDGVDFDAGGGDAADGLFTSRANATDEDVHNFHAKLFGFFGGIFGSGLGGVRRRFACTLEPA